MATIPTVQVWSTGQFVTSSQMNAGIGNVLSWLLSPPRVILFRNVNLTLASSTNPGVVSWTTELVDTDTMWASGKPTRITFNTPGLYLVENALHIATQTAGTTQLGTGLNGNGAWGTGIQESTLPATGSSFGPGLNHSFSYYFNVGDYIEAFCAQNSGASVNAYPGANYFAGHFGAKWIASS